MKTVTKHLIVALALCLLLAAGCSNRGAQVSATDSGATTSTATPAPQNAAEAGQQALARAKQGGETMLKLKQAAAGTPQTQ